MKYERGFNMPARKKRSSTEETVPAAEEEMAVETDEELEAIEETEIGRAHV